MVTIAYIYGYHSILVQESSNVVIYMLIMGVIINEYNLPVY